MLTFYYPRQFPFRIPLFYGFPFVKVLFSLGQCDLDFGKAPVTDKNAQRNNGKSPFFAFGLQFFEFLFGQEQLPVPFRLMVIKRSVRVFCDVHVTDIETVVEERTKRIVDVGFSFANGFDFRAKKPDTCHIRVEYVIFEEGLFIFDIDI